MSVSLVHKGEVHMMKRTVLSLVALLLVVACIFLPKVVQAEIDDK